MARPWSLPPLSARRPSVAVVARDTAGVATGGCACSARARSLSLGRRRAGGRLRAPRALEPDGITPAKLANIAKIKAERGARIGRFIVASTTAK